MKISRIPIFLIDGAGAFLSAMMLGLILPNYDEFLGLSTSILYGLAIMALLLSIYSISCYFLVKELKPGPLIPMLLGNMSYCLVTGAVLFITDDLNKWGRVYFILEIGVILGLFFYELKLYRRTSNVKSQ